MTTLSDQLTAAGWPGVLLAVLLAFLGRNIYRHTWRRRKGCRAFAARHGLRFVGTAVPDARPPYIQFEHLTWSVTLSNTVEGPWNELQVAVFDYNVTKRSKRTAAIVGASSSLGYGTHPAQPPFDEVMTSGDLLFVRSPTLLPPSALPGFLSSAVDLARTMSAEAHRARAEGVPLFRSLV